MRRLIVIPLLWIAAWLIAAVPVETVVVGEVYDDATGEPMANVNIAVQGTSQGTTTNDEGLFLLRMVSDKKRTIVVSAVGYRSERFGVQPGQPVGLQVRLKERVGSIDEVMVLPGENPALPLMAQVREHRAQNRREADMAQAATSVALYVSDIQARHLTRHIWKSLQAGMIGTEDSTYLLPLYYRHDQGGASEEKAAMMTSTNYQALLGQLQPVCRFYGNNVAVMSASFVSPLASAGGTYYRYYLADSVRVGEEKHYVLHFKTKNAFYPTWNGSMTIDSATYALRSIDATVPAQSNINYLRQLTVRQEYGRDNRLTHERLTMTLDFAVKADTGHTFPTLLLVREVRLPEGGVSVEGTQEPGSDYGDSVAYAAMDKLDSVPLFRFARFCAYVIESGYLPTSRYVEVGRLTETLKYSRQEGLRVGVPLRTTEQLWKDVSLEGFVAYGIGDRAFKGAGMVHVNIPSTRRHQLHVRYGDEYVYSDVNEMAERLRENSTWSPQMSLVTNWLQGAVYNPQYYYNTAVRRREARLLAEDEWTDNIETRAYIKVGRMGYGQPTRDYDAQSSFAYTTLGGSVRLSFHERKVDTYFHRRHIYNRLPVLFVGAEIGSYQTDAMTSYRMYGNVNVLLRQHVDMGVGGVIDYAVQAGTVIGRVPYPLLHIMPGNQTYTYDAYRFTLMNNYQYAADYYMTLHANWNGGGVLLNLIPGVRYLRLRELVEVKVAYGGIYGKHSSVVPFPTLSGTAAQGSTTLSSLQVPYVEVGVGLGNILRIGEVYSIWRVTHINDPAAPFWTMRFRLKLGL